MEEDAVGGEGEVGFGVLGRELFDEEREVFSEKGFTTGEADLFCAEADEDGRETRDLFVGQDE